MVKDRTPARNRRELIVPRLGQWLAVWCLLGIGIAVGWRIKIHHVRAGTAQLAQWEQASEPLRQFAAELLTMEARLDELERRGAPVAVLQPVAQPAALLEMIGRAAAAAPSQVAVTELQWTTQADEGVQIRIDGVVADERAAVQFVAALQSAGMFERVELETVDPSATASRRFAVRATSGRAPLRVAEKPGAPALEDSHGLR